MIDKKVYRYIYKYVYINLYKDFLLKFQPIDLIIYISFIINAIVFIWFFRFLPMQDYPDWLYQGYIFSQAMKGQPIFDFQIIDYPVANSVSTFFIGLFSLFLHTEISGKLFLTIYVFIFTFGSFSPFFQFHIEIIECGMKIILW